MSASTFLSTGLSLRIVTAVGLLAGHGLVGGLLGCSAPAGAPADEATPTAAMPAPVGADGVATAPAPQVINAHGPDAGVVVPPAPFACEPAALPSEDVCTVHEAFGVFVSVSKGSPDGDGTRSAPLDNLDAAITLAKATNRRVYACAENYRENLELASGVSIFGYFDCPSWTVNAAHAARVSAAQSPVATATSITAATRLEGLELVAPDASAPGSSSIALRAVGSPALTLVDVKLIAGKGAAGANGVAPVQLVEGGRPNGAGALSRMEAGVCTATYGATGCRLVYDAARAGGTSQCVGASGFDGGPGGVGGRSGIYEPSGTPIYTLVRQPELGLPSYGTAQTAQGAGSLDLAHDGAPGATGVDGVSATSAVGTFSANGFVPASGSAGTHGAPGQGGGGGRALTVNANVVTSKVYGESGSGGGAGGCPGLAGTPGQGGGASIALFAVDSPLRIERSELRSSRGGDGGAGTLGSEALPGGAAGSAVRMDALAHGGAGGAGGRAGVSGHGAGGPSVALAHHGAAPTVVGSTLIAGPGGSGRLAASAPGRSLTASPAGATKQTHAF